MITAASLASATGMSVSNVETWQLPLESAMAEYKIDSPMRQAHFLAQVGHESAGFKTLVESLNYSIDGLLKGFSRSRISEFLAKEYGRSPTHPADQKAIANCVYGGQWGKDNLGNVALGDGWKYRGRGLIQLTGLANYKACGAALKLDLVNNPDLLLLPGPAALAAAWFWSSKGLNRFADANDIVTITKRINGGDKGLDDRKARYAQAYKALI